ncbi:MAG: DUF1553 domain-containing protein [Planctomycetota bacterium]|nr:DUF1553 domain-containing protein [Planctomycetota bacterium]
MLNTVGQADDASRPAQQSDRVAVVAGSPAGQRLRFSRDIRPLLSNVCYSCHGVDESARKAGLRLDIFEKAIAPADSGDVAIVPGKPDESELIRRIFSEDPADMMPPPASNKTLSAAEKERLKLWIAEGATYESHWAFTTPQRPKPPQVKLPGPLGVAVSRPDHPTTRTVVSADWPTNVIDQFVLARILESELHPTAMAHRSTLLRRVSFDLTGLPPTLAETRAFLADDSPEAYERLVDRLLASEAFGERMGQLWLDLARYADTNGYNNDEDRTMWLWREWVIDAFNANMPFDQFLVEQIAGDLLPDATLEQRVATGFNRNHVITTEGGIFPEEYRVEYVADRVHTTSSVFLGLSLQCARCHDHKYDPFTQNDYYRLFAFFNNVADKTVGYNSGAPAEPYLKVTPRRWKRDHDRLLAERLALDDALTRRVTAAEGEIAAWERTLSPADIEKLPSDLIAQFSFEEGEGTTTANLVALNDRSEIQGVAKWTDGKVGRALEFDGQTHVTSGGVGAFERNQSFTLAAWILPTANEGLTVVSKMDEGAGHRGYDLIFENGRLAVHLIHNWPDNGLKVQTKKPMSINAWHHVAATYDGSSTAAGVKLYVDGQPAEVEATADKLTETVLTEQPFRIGVRTSGVRFKGKIDEVQVYSASLAPEAIGDLANGKQIASGVKPVLAIAPEQRTAAQKQLLTRYFLASVDTEHRRLTAARRDIDQSLAAFEKAVPATMVMQELAQPRETFILRRGQYDQPGDKVSAGTPASLPPLPAGLESNRLALARWFVDRQNPLTARVMVNRFWQQLFGIGIVETVEDFGLQGAFPTHPELLDWLAVDFQESGWDLKALLRKIVLSATYRQSSDATAAQIERDPKNQFLARGSRLRLPAETLRDNALSVAGLLTHRLGGPSVKPYQPAGIWQDVSVERRAVYEPSRGGDLYRRSLYTFWKRTCPPPGMTSFDAPDRETCTIRRARTNTPLQALVLLNDPTYVEAARELAQRVVRDGGATDKAKLETAWLSVVARKPTADEARSLLAIVQSARKHFQLSPDSAIQLISVGESPRDQQLDPSEVAAWTTSLGILLNLDEAITRE